MADDIPPSPLIKAHSTLGSFDRPSPESTRRSSLVRQGTAGDITAHRSWLPVGAAPSVGQFGASSGGGGPSPRGGSSAIWDLRVQLSGHTGSLPGARPLLQTSNRGSLMPSANRGGSTGRRGSLSTGATPNVRRGSMSTRTSPADRRGSVSRGGSPAERRDGSSRKGSPGDFHGNLGGSSSKGSPGDRRGSVSKGGSPADRRDGSSKEGSSAEHRDSVSKGGLPADRRDGSSKEGSSAEHRGSVSKGGSPADRRDSSSKETSFADRLITGGAAAGRRDSSSRKGSPTDRSGSVSSEGSSAERLDSASQGGSPAGRCGSVSTGECPGDRPHSSEAHDAPPTELPQAAGWPTEVPLVSSANKRPSVLSAPQVGHDPSLRWVTTPMMTFSQHQSMLQQEQDRLKSSPAAAGRHTSPALQRLGICLPSFGASEWVRPSSSGSPWGRATSAGLSWGRAPSAGSVASHRYRFPSGSPEFGRGAASLFGRAGSSSCGRAASSPLMAASSGQTSPHRKKFQTVMGNVSKFGRGGTPSARSPLSGNASPTSHKFRTSPKGVSEGLSRVSTAGTAVSSAPSGRSGRSVQSGHWCLAREEVIRQSEKILQPDKLHFRMKQLDGIIKRKADKVLFSMKSTQAEDDLTSTSKKNSRKLKIAKEMLLRVQKRRMKKRAYMYVSLFFVFFCLFLMKIYVRNVSSMMRAVRQSIGFKLSDSLPDDFLQSEDNFYDWLDALVLALFPSPKCGDGLCDTTCEFPRVGEWGCQEDCGRNMETTRVRVRLKPAWQSLPGKNTSSIIQNSEDGLGLVFRYNLWSETLGRYVLANDSSDFSDEVSLPDGKYRLELYHNTASPSMALPSFLVGTTSGLAPSTLPVLPLGSPVLSYGFPGYVVLASVALSAQIASFCSSQVSYSNGSVCNGYDSQKTFKSLMAGYGLGGCVSVSKGLGANAEQRNRNLVCFDRCAAPEIDDVRFAGAGVDPSLCPDAMGNPNPSCKNASLVFSGFSCRSSYDFELWEFGPPRNVSVGLGESNVGPRFLTSFNVLLGGIVITQRRRKDAPCPVQPTSYFDVLSVFPCHEADTEQPFGTDAVFVSSSKLFTGKASCAAKYVQSEMRTDSVRPGPFGFFPHQWGVGGPKDDRFVVPFYNGSFPLFMDGSLSPDQAALLGAYVRDASFFDGNAQSVMVDFLTFNKPGTILSVTTVDFVRDYGGNTRWTQKTATISLEFYTLKTAPYMYSIDVFYFLVLLFDLWHNSHAVFLAYRRKELHVYVRKPFNYFTWIHILILFAIAIFESAIISQSATLQLPAQMDVLADPTSTIRPFATIPEREAVVLQFLIEVKGLSDRISVLAAVQALTTFCFVLRLVSLLHFQDLVHFLLVFLFLLFCYGAVGVILVGHLVKPFQTLPSAMQYLAFTCLGWHDTYEELMAAKSSNQNNTLSLVVFQLFFWTWLIIATFLMLNFLLSIIVAAYAQTRSRHAQGETMSAEIFDFLSVEFRIFWSSIYGYTPFRDKHVERCLKGILDQGQRVQDVKEQLGKSDSWDTKKQEPKIHVGGGLVVNACEMASMMEGIFARGKNLLHSMYDLEAINPLGGVKEPGDLADAEEGRAEGAENPNATFKALATMSASAGMFKPKKSIHKIMKRYGTIVDERKNDEDLLSLLKIEHVKMVLANQVSLTKLSQQVMHLLDKSVGIAEVLLSSEALEAILQGILIKLSMERRVLSDIATLLKASSHTIGCLTVHVQRGRNLPARHVFATPELYVAMFLQHTQFDGSDPRVSPFGKTSHVASRNKPIWDDKIKHDVMLCAGAQLLVYVMEHDKFSGDKCVAHCAFDLEQIPVDDDGVEGWFKVDSQLHGQALFGSFGSRVPEVLLSLTYRAYDEMSSLHGLSPGRPLHSPARTSPGRPLQRSEAASRTMSPLCRAASGNLLRVPSDAESRASRRSLYMTQCHDAKASEQLGQELGWMVAAVEAHRRPDENESSHAADRLYGGIVAHDVSSVHSRRLGKTDNIMRSSNLLARTMSAFSELVRPGSVLSKGSWGSAAREESAHGSQEGNSRKASGTGSASRKSSAAGTARNASAEGTTSRASLSGSAECTESVARSSEKLTNESNSVRTASTDHNPGRHHEPQKGKDGPKMPTCTTNKPFSGGLITGLLDDLLESSPDSIDVEHVSNGEHQGSVELLASLTNTRGGFSRGPYSTEQRLDFSTRVKPPDAGVAWIEGGGGPSVSAGQKRSGPKERRSFERRSLEFDKKQNIVNFFRNNISKYTPTKARKDGNPQEGASPSDAAEPTSPSKLSIEYGSMVEFSVHGMEKDTLPEPEEVESVHSEHDREPQQSQRRVERKPSFVIVRPAKSVQTERSPGKQKRASAAEPEQVGAVERTKDRAGVGGSEEEFMC